MDKRGDSQITCTADKLETGDHPVQVTNPETGLSNSDVTFTYTVGQFTISPDKGTVLLVYLYL